VVPQKKSRLYMGKRRKLNLFSGKKRRFLLGITRRIRHIVLALGKEPRFDGSGEEKGKEAYSASERKVVQGHRVSCLRQQSL